MKSSYLGYTVGDTVTSSENVPSQYVDNSAVMFRPGMQGMIVKICPWVSKPDSAKGRFYFLVGFEYAGEVRYVGLKSHQIRKPGKGK